MTRRGQRPFFAEWRASHLRRRPRRNRCSKCRFPAAPIVYLKRQEFKSLALGEITSKTPDYKIYKALLETSVEEGYAKLIGP